MTLVERLKRLFLYEIKLLKIRAFGEIDFLKSQRLEASHIPDQWLDVQWLLDYEYSRAVAGPHPGRI